MDSSDIPTPAESANEPSDELATPEATEPSSASLPPEEDESADELEASASATSSPQEEEEGEADGELEGESSAPALALPPEPSATMRSRHLVEVPAEQLTGRVDPNLLPESP